VTLSAKCGVDARTPAPVTRLTRQFCEWRARLESGAGERELLTETVRLAVSA
jgi:hypothetical protein